MYDRHIKPIEKGDYLFINSDSPDRLLVVKVIDQNRFWGTNIEYKFDRPWTNLDLASDYNEILLKEIAGSDDIQFLTTSDTPSLDLPSYFRGCWEWGNIGGCYYLGRNSTNKRSHEIYHMSCDHELFLKFSVNPAAKPWTKSMVSGGLNLDSDCAIPFDAIPLKKGRILYFNDYVWNPKRWIYDTDNWQAYEVVGEEWMLTPHHEYIARAIGLSFIRFKRLSDGKQFSKLPSKFRLEPPK